MVATHVPPGAGSIRLIRTRAGGPARLDRRGEVSTWTPVRGLVVVAATDMEDRVEALIQRGRDVVKKQVQGRLNVVSSHNWIEPSIWRGRTRMFGERVAARAIDPFPQDKARSQRRSCPCS